MTKEIAKVTILDVSRTSDELRRGDIRPTPIPSSVDGEGPEVATLSGGAWNPELVSGRLGSEVGVVVEVLDTDEATSVAGSSADSIGMVTGFLDAVVDKGGEVGSGALVVAIVVVVRSLDGFRSAAALSTPIIARLCVRPRRN